MSDLVVQEQRLPGIGWRFELPLDDESTQSLVIVVADRGARHLMVFDEHSEEPRMSVRLPQNHAAALAALLTGARFATTQSHDSRCTSHSSSRVGTPA